VATWIVAWAGGAVIGAANGAKRKLALERIVGEPTANRVSVATAIAATGVWSWPLAPPAVASGPESTRMRAVRR
jgi:hypothetical protein